jgi:hypothetical protein
MNQKKQNPPSDLVLWEDYDHSLTLEENFHELKVQMGFLDEAHALIHQVRTQSFFKPE